MKNKKIIFFFFCVIFFMSFGAWQFVRSDYVSSQINSRLNTLLGMHGYHVLIKSVLPTLPFGTVAKNIKIRYESSGDIFEVNISKVDFNFDFLSFFTRNIKIKNISVEGVLIRNLSLNRKDKVSLFTRQKLNATYLYLELKRSLGILPFRISSLDGIDLSYQDGDVKYIIPEFKLKNIDKRFNFKLSLENYSNTVNDYFDGVKLEGNLTRNIISLSKSSINWGLNKFSAVGTLANIDNLKMKIKVSGNGDKFVRMANIEKVILNSKYDFVGDFHRKRGVNHLMGKVELQDFVLPWLDFSSIKSQVLMNENTVYLLNVNAQDSAGGRMVCLQDKIPVFDIKNKRLLVSKQKINLKNVFLGNLLKFVKGKQLEIDGSVNGNVILEWNSQGISINSVMPLNVQRFKLLDILNIPNVVTLDKFNLNIPFSKKAISLDGNLKIENTNINFAGTVGTELQINARNSHIVFDELGLIGGVPLKGDTQGDLRIISGAQDSFLEYKFKGSGFSALDYFIGNPEGKLRYHFNTNKLNFEVDRSKLGQAQLSGIGRFDFNKNSLSSLSIKVENAEVKDLDNALKSILPSDLLQWSNVLQGRFNCDVLYEGVLSQNRFAIDIKATSPYLFILDEPFENFSLHLSDVDHVLKISNLSLFKNKKKLAGQATLNLNSNSFEFMIFGAPVSVKYFEVFRNMNLNFNSNLSFESSGKGTFTDYTSRTVFKLDKTIVSNSSIGDSFLEVYNIGSEFFVTANLFGKEVESSLYLNTNRKNKGKRSFAQLKIGIDDLKKYLAILNPSLVMNSYLKGAVDLDISSDFQWKQFDDLNLVFSLKNFFLKTSDDLILNKRNSSFKIENGVANKQQLSIVGKKTKLMIMADGKLGSHFSGDLKLKTSVEWLQTILSNVVEHASGDFVLDAHLNNVKKIYDLTTSVVAKKISIIPKEKMIVLRGVDLSLEQRGMEVHLQSCSGIINSGQFQTSGKMKMGSSYPEVYFDYNISNMGLNLLKNSTISLSSFGKVFGNDRPYTIEGGVSLESGLIASELSDIAGENRDAGYDRSYLPRIMRVANSPFLNINMDYVFTNPLVIQNSLVELYLRGKGKVVGDLNNIRPLGQIDIEPLKSKFMFKGNDFIIEKGIIKFNDSYVSEDINPSLQIVGKSSIGQYDVTVDVKGDTKNPVADLSSEPVLAESDILSLLMIGITANQANNMNEAERRLATSVGIGSIFANQLRLGKELNNMFGVKLSVMPELSEDNSNYVDSISSTGNGTKIRTSTKIQLRKKIKENIELSFSSTVGGTSEQTQKINVNYNFNKHISLEGLYEVRDTTIENRLTEPESLGVDFKFMMDFE